LIRACIAARMAFDATFTGVLIELDFPIVW